MNSPKRSDTQPQTDMTTPPTGDLPPSKSLQRSPSRLSSSANRTRNRARSKRWWLLLVVLLIVSTAAAGTLIYWKTIFGDQQYYTGLVSEVKEQPLQLRVVSRGEVEAARNNDIKCLVKTSDRRSGGVKLMWVIDDGTYARAGQDLDEYGASVVGQLVSPLGFSPLLTAASLYPERQGDLLVMMDSTPLEDELLDQQIKVDQAVADMITAQEQLKITLNFNKREILAANVALTVAKLEEKSYLDGEFLVEKAELLKQIEDGEADLKMWRERLSFTKRMNYRGYSTEPQVFAEQAKTQSATINLQILRTKLDVLENLTRKKMEAELDGKKVEAELALEIAEAEAHAKEIQARADAETKTKIYQQELARLKDTRQQIHNCFIFAPRDGLVIHHVSEQSRWGRGGTQSVIAPGEPVTFDQKLMQIPDLTRMQVKCRIHEAMVKYINPSGSDQIPATIRISAYPKRVFQGYVKSVASIASKADYFSSDVRVYETIVAIDEELENQILKPGMSAEITILAYETPGPVTTIPIQAVVGNLTMNEERKCFVIKADGTAEMRDIVIGMSNERLVEVKSGLKAGERVALDPNSLLPTDGSLRGARPPRTDDKKGGGPGMKGGKKGGKDELIKGGNANGLPGAKGPLDGEKKAMNNNAPQENNFSPERMAQFQKMVDSMTDEQREQMQQLMKAQGSGAAD